MPHSTARAHAPSEFEKFNLPPKLLQALTRIKFTSPTPIQAQTIPLALEGKDVLGSAQTGTGKTGAFGIPVVAGLMNRAEATALIMTPTRELASQVLAALEPMIPTVDIRTALLIGGDPMTKQMHQLRHHPRPIVGTPGRINDHLERGTLKLDQTRFLVLDETDRMLDMGFGIQIERILKHIPDDRQTLLFSATLPSNITKLSGKYMRHPVRVAVGSTTVAATNIKQEVIPTTDAEKYGKLIEQIDSRKGSIIIFVKTKFGTEKLAAKLNKDAHHADAIHGDLQQRRRERVIQNFRDKKYRVLVATDVAARGLDIPHIEHVINYDMPQAPEDYIHRIGRTARAGAQGEAISFLTSADTQKWRAIQRLMNGEDPNAPPVRRGPPRGRSGSGGSAASKPGWKKEGGYKGSKPWGDKPKTERSFEDRPRSSHAEGERASSDRPRSEGGYKPWESKPAEKKSWGDKPRGERSFGDKPRSAHTEGAGHASSDKPRSEGGYKGSKPWGDKPKGDRKFGDRSRDDRAGGDKPRGERSFGDKPRSDRPRSAESDRPKSEAPKGVKPWGDKPRSDKPRSDKPKGDKPWGEKRFGDKPRTGKPGGGKFFGKGASNTPRSRG